jgi:hypothetical protein
MHQGCVAQAAVRQISGNRREEQAHRQVSGNRRVEQARDTAARRVQRQATPNRAQEQQRARTKRKENEEKKLLAFYAKLQEAEARLGQDKESSVQSTIHDEKLRRLAENDFDFDIFLDNPVMEAVKKMHQELKELVATAKNIASTWSWTNTKACASSVIRTRQAIGQCLALTTISCPGTRMSAEA